MIRKTPKLFLGFFYLKTGGIYLSLFGFILGWWLLFQPVTVPSFSSSSSFSVMSENLKITSFPLNRDTVLEKLQTIPESIKLTTAQYDISFSVQDHRGNTLTLSKPILRFLPQTYGSAAILMTLLPPYQIVAIPKAMRKEPHIYPQKVMEQISTDSHRYNTEKIYLQKPELALVASYSDPATLQVFQQQKIQLFYLDAIHSIEDIYSVIATLGHLSGKPSSAEVLIEHMQKIFFSLEDTLHQKLNGKNCRLLYLYSDSLTIPAKNNLSYDLLIRLKKRGVDVLLPDDNISSSHYVKVTEKQILEFNPDLIIISTSHPSLADFLLDKNPRLHRLPAVKNKRIYFVNNSFQNSPNQYITIAYFDLIKSIFYDLEKTSQEVS